MPPNASSPIGICKLCLETQPLLNSHIIPEFQYRPLYDNLHRFTTISSDPKTTSKFVQKGIRERLLCANCEQKLSVWERYSAGVIFSNNAQLVQRVPEGYILGGVKYPEFRLFLLSLLWRMGASTVPMFSMVQLGEHEEKLRLMVLNEQPGDWGQYPCFLTGLTLGGKFYPDWMHQPDIVATEDGTTCRVVIGGILYFFFLNTEPIPDAWHPFTLNPN
ncbi:MAG TPA: hypothetical protein VMC06_10735, partial [Opitutaceae bacterium]|nr:hypothetical protein [Opitutaceae bacterium]